MIKTLCFFVGFSLLVQMLPAQKVKTLSICAGSSTSITVSTDINKTYQWQVKTAVNSGYNNIINNAFYSGVNTGTLAIAAAATSMAGYQFRCLITEQLNTSSSDITVLKFKAIWNGQTDSIWNRSSNWNCGIVPDENTEIMIQAGAAYYPFINFNVTCRKLSMAPNSSLNLANGFTIKITGSDTVLPEAKAPQKMQVDSLQTVLLSTEAETETGLFRYNTFPGYKNISEGDFLIEPRNYGYLRKVEMVDSTSNGVRFYTSQGTLSQLYKDSGSISQTVIIPDTKNPFGGSGGRSNKSNNPNPLALQVPDFSVSIPNGSIAFTGFLIKLNPNPTFNFNIKNRYLKAGFVNTNYGFSFDAKITLALDNNTGAPEKLEFDITDKIPAIKALKLPFSFGAVFGHMEFHVILRAKGKVSSSLQQTLHYEYTANRNAYIERANGVTNPVFNTGTPVTVFEPSTREWALNAGLGVEVDLLPKIFLYRVPVVNLGISGSLDLESSVNLENKAWNAAVSFLVGGKANTQKTLFDFMENADVTVPFFDPINIWQAPSRLDVLSGTDQTASINKSLPQPIVFLVQDNFNNNIPGVRVFFSSNKGNWEQAYATTGNDGRVSNKFRFGNTVEDHELTAVIKKADNTIIKTVTIILKPGTPPVVSTTAITAITDRTAISGGNVTIDGGSAVTQRGICWNTMNNPTVFNLKTASGNGLGNFASNITGLTANTTYHVRAYAINSTDTAYGADIYFKTDSVFELVSHGQWTAVEGFIGDAVLGDTALFAGNNSGCPEVPNNNYQYFDTAYMKFNADGTGYLTLFVHEWGTTSCNSTPFDNYTTNSKVFSWQKTITPNVLELIFTGGFLNPDDGPINFSISSLSSTQLHLNAVLSPDPEDPLYFDMKFK